MTFRLRQKSWAKPVQAAQDAEQEEGIDSSETIRQLLTQEKSINRNETEELDQHICHTFSENFWPEKISSFTRLNHLNTFTIHLL